MDELTTKEKKFLGMLLAMSRAIIKTSGGYFDLWDETSPESYFSETDLFNLATKLGVENMY